MVWGTRLPRVDGCEMMRRQTRIGKALVLSVVLLLTISIAAQMAHSHSHAPGDLHPSHHCQLCMTAHAAVFSHAVWQATVVLPLAGQVIVGNLSCDSRDFLFTTFIRPPPAESISA